jgi:hypothetical protein
MIDLLKLLGGLLVGLFRSRAAREAEMAFLRQQRAARRGLWTRSARRHLVARAADPERRDGRVTLIKAHFAASRSEAAVDAARRTARVWPQWLGEALAEVPQLKAVLARYPSGDMICWPVGARVGNVKNNDPSLIEPIAAA